MDVLQKYYKGPSFLHSSLCRGKFSLGFTDTVLEVLAGL